MDMRDVFLSYWLGCCEGHLDDYVALLMTKLCNTVKLI